MRSSAVKKIREFDRPSVLLRDAPIKCNWQALRDQLLSQWEHLTAKDIDIAGPDRRRIARLIERKYGISSQLVENYLHNFERTLPAALA